MKIKSSHIAILAVCAVLFAFIVTGTNPLEWIPTQSTTPWTPSQPTPTPPTSVPTGSWYGPLYLSVVDSVTGTAFTTSTTTVDQIGAVNGLFDFISGPQKSTAQAANPQSAGRIWNEGDEVIVMTDCTGNPTNGLDYYPVMFYMKLTAGGRIYELDSDACFTKVGTNPVTYRINPSAGKVLPQTVTPYESSNVKYWNIGDLYAVPRQAAADVDIYLTYGGTTLASVTDASTWVDTAAEITANATLASDLETAQFKMIGANANLGWGKHFFVVEQDGSISEYGAVIVVSTAMTAIKVPSGWNSITMSTLYAEKAFYKILDPDTIATDSDVSGAMIPQKGFKPSWTVDIDIDATSATASTAYLFNIWIEDCQKLGDVGTVGTSTGTPTAYGFVTSYGVGAVVHNTALTVSSGVGATEQLCTYLTTAA